ncbi:MAG: hypothetical protein AzoDbin1_03211 [Azoarcus sp.]|nr:hypothetical protein [Azoarcus sp.]
MKRTHARAWRNLFLAGATALATLGTGMALAEGKAAVFEGKPVKIGQGTAHTVVRTGADGAVAAIGVVFTEGMLDGLPVAAPGANPLFSYVLGMPAKGPKTAVDHVMIDWESLGHPPPQVYDVPHFDFHFYVVSREEVSKVRFNGPNDSADPGQQPPAELMPAGYSLPPGTAVPRMGVHAINPTAPEFQKQPFTATFIYGYYKKRLTFVEPMASLEFFRSKPSFSAPVPRPAKYSKSGTYPSRYSVGYDDAKKVYEVMLEELR